MMPWREGMPKGYIGGKARDVQRQGFTSWDIWDMTSSISLLPFPAGRVLSSPPGRPARAGEALSRQDEVVRDD